MMKKLLFLFFIIFIFYTSIFAQKHSFYWQFEVNQTVFKAKELGVNNRGIEFGKFHRRPSFTTGISYALSPFKKEQFKFIAAFLFRRYVHQSEYYFYPNLFIAEDEAPLARELLTNFEYQYHLLELRLGGEYQFLNIFDGKWIPFIGTTFNVYHPLIKQAINQFGGQQFKDYAYMGDLYQGKASDYSVYFNNLIKIGSTLDFGVEVNPQQEHLIRLSLSYTYGQAFGIIRYNHYNYLGEQLSTSIKEDRIRSLNLKIQLRL
jgi:hypothetical protein